MPNKDFINWDRTEQPKFTSRRGGKVNFSSFGTTLPHGQRQAKGFSQSHRTQVFPVPSCEKCSKSFSSEKKLRFHLQNSEKHRYDSPNSFFPDYPDYDSYPENSKKSKQDRTPKHFPCWGCKASKKFDSLPEMLQHIEDNECHDGWTIQHLNKLAAECKGSEQFIIPGRKTWFRAGAPPLKPKKTEYDPYVLFCCPICKTGYEEESELKQHLKEQECSSDYPSVLHCPRCPDSGFERLSELFKHLLEGHNIRYRESSLEKWVQSLEKKFQEPGVQRNLDKNPVELHSDRRRPGKLCVVITSLDTDELRGRELD